MSSITNSAGSFFNRSLAQMAALRSGIERTRTQIATGTKIERGSQDPAVAAQLRSVARREALAQVEGDNAARLGQDLGAAANEVQAVTSLLQRARELAVQAIVCNQALWDRSLMRLAREEGWRALAYTVNDESAAERLIDLGLDGIITDRIDLFAPVA